MSHLFSITNTTRTKVPDVDFLAIKDEILGKKYEMSLIFTTREKIKKLNLIYRNKNVATDILSFPISENIGEIYICPKESIKEMKKFDRDYDSFITFLFIHGCVHLKGFDHGGTMEELESSYRKIFC